MTSSIEDRGSVVAALMDVASNLAEVKGAITSLTDQIPHLTDQVDVLVTSAIDSAHRAIEEANKVEKRMTRRSLILGVPLVLLLALVAVTLFIVTHIDESIQRNHSDNVQTQTLFCDALKNAGLPYPTTCDSLR